MPRTIRGPYLITTSPTMTECTRCHRPVLACCVGGLDRHIGTEALNDAGELVALLSGCKSYELRGDEFVQRNAAMIGQPRGSAPVMADHRCAAVPVSQIDVMCSARAVVLVVTALGGSVVTARDTSDPPF